MLCCLQSVAMVTAGGSQPVSDFPATISKKLNNDYPLLKSTDNWYAFLVKLCQNIYGVQLLLTNSVDGTQGVQTHAVLLLSVKRAS